MPASADDKLIWSLSSDAKLPAARSMVMEQGEQAFTAGRVYKVESMHPIADPPFVRVVDDQGITHQLAASDIRDYFGR